MSSKRTTIQTDSAPEAIGTYSQAIKVGGTVYLSGQIPLVPVTMELVVGDMETQIKQVFENLKAVAEAAGGGLADIAKLNIFLTSSSLASAFSRLLTMAWAILVMGITLSLGSHLFIS